MKARKIQSKRVQKPMQFRQSLFWDVDPKTIDPKENARYVIERILDFGDQKEVEWMTSYYNSAFIQDIIRASRSLLTSRRAYWGSVYGLKLDESPRFPEAWIHPKVCVGSM